MSSSFCLSHLVTKDRSYMISLQTMMEIINCYANARVGEGNPDFAEDIAEINASMNEQKKVLPLSNRKIMFQLISDATNLIACDKVNLEWVNKAIANKFPEFLNDIEYATLNLDCKNLVLKEKFYEYILPTQRKTIDQLKLSGGIGGINPEVAATIDKMSLDQLKKFYSRKIKDFYEKIIAEMRIAQEENILLPDILNTFTMDTSCCIYMEKRISFLEQ